MWGTSTEERKKALRTAALYQRNALSTSESVTWSRLIQAKALELPGYLASRSVALYSPIQNEVGTDDILKHALNEKRQVFFPKIAEESSIEFFQVLSVAELKVGRFGIPEPMGVRRLSASDCAGLMVFVPGVAFDAQGNRLGRGRGGYDRALKRLGKEATFIALAYEFQIVDAVPTELWDQKVHYIITERRVLDCGTLPAQSSQIS
jgi:5-formyltetrahydrofolate cyclo-ligase